MTQERLAELKQVIEDIQFENKSKYVIEIPGNFGNYLSIYRNIVCSVSGQPTPIYNSARLPKDVTNDQLIKILFMSIGQFEAHEFVESFKYKGIHAYFPHEVGGKVLTLYTQSNHINNLLLQPWRDVVASRNNFNVGIRYIWRGTLNVIKVPFKAFDKMCDYIAELIF